MRYKLQALASSFFVSLEPCSHFGQTPPCAKTIIENGISTLYFASYDPNPEVLGNGVKMLVQNKVKVIHMKGFAEDAFRLNAGFYQSHVHKRPWIELKIAQDIDKRIACGNGEVPIFTSQVAQDFTQKLRSQVDAIVTSSRTIQQDNPLLSLRSPLYPSNVFRQPKLIVLDSQLSSLPSSRIFLELNREIILVYSQENFHKRSDYPQNCQFLQVKSYQGLLDLASVFEALGRKKIQSVFIEAGSQLSTALLEQKLCDRLHVYTHKYKLETKKTQESALQSYTPDQLAIEHQRFLDRSFLPKLLF